MVPVRKTSAAFGVLAPFALCALLTVAATAFVGFSEREAERGRFANAANATRDLIEVRMASYEGLLRGSAGLLSQFEPVTVEGFRIFADELKLSEKYPGTMGVGYSVRFGAVSASEATARARAAGWTDVNVRPETPRDEVHAIVLIEPRSERNLVVLGYDMYTEPTRREAMDRARDQGDLALSGKVTLLQEIGPEKQPGFLLYLPVYAGGVVPPSVEERRAKLKAYVYAPLRAGDLFEGIFGSEKPTLSFELYDGEDPSAATLLYALASPDAHDEVNVQRIEIAGHVWTARFMGSSATHAFPRTLGVAAFGALLSLVVLVVTRGRERARNREARAKASAEASEEMLRFTELFVGILGHDLRSPLGAISLGCDVLKKEVGGNEKATRIVARILASSRRMARMIDQILDLTRSRLGGGLPVVPKPTDLGVVVKDVVGEIAEAKPECRVDLDVSGDLHGDWDPDRLAQVFSNLVGNAVAHSQGAPVRVELRGSEPERVVLKVHNAGVIPPELRPVLFEPFRGGARQGRVSSGLGLGLYITRSIVEGHEGTVEVESAEGQGTTFTVVLPRRGPVSTPRAGSLARRPIGRS
ncbi:MAG TPA: CHASE domain-containing protein, partial [Polyangiaceae bacterium]|nr:CHASE domain-containing protein [Polyangiaceae bacterium]